MSGAVERVHLVLLLSAETVGRGADFFLAGRGADFFLAGRGGFKQVCFILLAQTMALD